MRSEPSVDPTEWCWDDLPSWCPGPGLASTGPTPGTGSRSVARLCRFHHRVKTHTGWHYQRLPDDPTGRHRYQWTSPYGYQWIVDARGTTAITIPT